jgi:hypothetical protein
MIEGQVVPLSFCVVTLICFGKIPLRKDEVRCFYLIRLFVMNFITKLAHIAEGVMQPIQKGHEMFAIHVHSPRFIPVQLSPHGLIEEHLMIG